MAKRAVSTPEAAPPGGPYSQAVVAGDHVYLAGAVPTKPDGTPVRGTFEEQGALLRRYTPAQFAEFLKKEQADYEQIVRAAGIKEQ